MRIRSRVALQTYSSVALSLELQRNNNVQYTRWHHCIIVLIPDSSEAVLIGDGWSVLSTCTHIPMLEFIMIVRCSRSHRSASDHA